jgi:hypothetical protein
MGFKGYLSYAFIGLLVFLSSCTVRVAPTYYRCPDGTTSENPSCLAQQPARYVCPDGSIRSDPSCLDRDEAYDYDMQTVPCNEASDCPNGYCDVRGNDPTEWRCRNDPPAKWDCGDHYCDFLTENDMTCPEDCKLP